MAKQTHRIPRKQDPGRKKGTANYNKEVRSLTLYMRCSQGLREVMKALTAKDSEGRRLYASYADVVHAAVKQLAQDKLTNDQDKYWLKKI